MGVSDDPKVEDSVEVKQEAIEDGEVLSAREDEEDIPDDFFDDFANQDFMDGLDIVDAWNDSVKRDNKAENGRSSSERRKSDRRSNRERSKSDRSKSDRDKKTSSKTFLPDESEMRRDPAKTKRDLERDRENYTKKRDQKLISKLVETGLVPPGMETEADLRELQNASASNKESGEKMKVDRRRERSSRDRREERIALDFKRQRLDVQLSPPSHRMEYRRLRPERRRISLSPSPPLMMLRRRRRSRSRSPSLERRRKDKRSSEGKMSFLEELQMKLGQNPVEPSVSYSSPQVQPMNYYPPPVQAPVHYYPCTTVTPAYDQNFFIGDVQPMPMPQPIVQPLRGLLEIPTYVNNQPVTPVPSPQVAVTPGERNTLSQLTTDTSKSMATSTGKPHPNINMKLTEFLSMNSKPEAFSSKPDFLPKKINVLSRCQDLLKELSEEKKLGGRLVLKKSFKKVPKLQERPKNASPLLYSDLIKFSFTSMPEESGKSWLDPLERVLAKHNVKAKSPTKTSDDVEKKKCQPLAAVVEKCADCERRKAIKYESVGTQCGESSRFDVGVQVTESDIAMSKMPKNRSLAYLTPAQLLGRDEATSVRVDQFGQQLHPHEHRTKLYYHNQRSTPDWQFLGFNRK